jgi:peroxiredoxin Q/BCP
LCSYRNHWAELSAQATIVGINPASAVVHRRFVDRHHFPFPLLSDTDGSCCRAYGATAWWGIRRLTVLVDTTGTIRWRKNAFILGWPSMDTLVKAVRSVA